MKSLSITELKRTFAEQLRFVRSGREVLITDRGRPVARLVPVDSGADGDEHLAVLEADGLVRVGSEALPRGFWQRKRPADPAGSLRAALDDEREASW